MTTYLSTRGGDAKKSFTDVLLNGLAPDGGLYIPDKWPSLSHDDIAHLSGVPYADVAQHVIAPFVGNDIDAPTLKRILSITAIRAFI